MNELWRYNFNKANEYLRKDEYQAAINIYQRLLMASFEPWSAIIRFNLGLAKRRKEKKIQDQLPGKSLHTGIPKIRFDETEEKYIHYEQKIPISSKIKLIAFYLPQFHPIPENDEWWGKGFTEWANVGKALPAYEGHYQPHCPIHFGYYDLRVSEVQEEQAALAKEYGIYGFSYYFYWFAGKTLLERPLLQMLENKKVDIPFCLTWANENWTRRWDGQENDVLMSQKHSIEDARNFIKYVAKYFKDDRYIRIENKPLLIVYRANIIPQLQSIVAEWKEEMLNLGFEGLYLVAAQTFGLRSPEPYCFDASVEFPPHTAASTDIRHELNITNKDFTGHIFSYEQVVENAVKYSEPEFKAFRAAMLSWDNTARKPSASHIFHGFSLLRYKQWLNSLCSHVFVNDKYSDSEKLVFINAWNEWAEGTHLEPDRKFGYAYLQATYDVIKQYDQSVVQEIYNQIAVKKADIAAIVHIHYIDTVTSILSYLDNFGSLSFDLYVTTTNHEIVKLIKHRYPDAYVRLVENRGRDILPFIDVLKLIASFDYTAVCKIHGKRSEYRHDGDRIRNELFGSLLGSSMVIDEIINKFRKNPRLGILVPKEYLIPHNDHNMTFDKEVVAELASMMDINFEYSVFPAGSMFWFRQSALSSLLLLDGSFFPLERGLADGTPAHAIERLFSVLVEKSGYQCSVIW